MYIFITGFQFSVWIVVNVRFSRRDPCTLSSWRTYDSYENVLSRWVRMSFPTNVFPNRSSGRPLFVNGKDLPSARDN